MVENSEGQIMLEMVFAVGIVALVLIALISSTTVSLRNVRFARDSALAASCAREISETMRVVRDRGGYDSLLNDVSFTVGSQQCVENPELFPAVFGGASMGCGDSDWASLVVLPDFMHRIKIEKSDVGRLEVTIAVAWSDSSCSGASDYCHVAETKTFLTSW